MAGRGGEAPGRPGPPPLRPFGLVLHHDGSWTHDGVPILNARLRRAFDRSVCFLPEEGKYVVQLGRFRGQIEVEEAAFFVRGFDAETATVVLSDLSTCPLDVATLRVSPRDGALLCRVKRDVGGGAVHLARFSHAAQAELLHAVVEGDGAPRIRLAGRLEVLPDL